MPGPFFRNLMISVLQPGIVMVTESWLSPEVDDCLLSLPYFELFRSDRIDGGCTCTYTWLNEALRPSTGCPLYTCQNLKLMIKTKMV